MVDSRVEVPSDSLSLGSGSEVGFIRPQKQALVCLWIKVGDSVRLKLKLDRDDDFRPVGEGEGSVPGCCLVGCPVGP